MLQRVLSNWRGWTWTALLRRMVVSLVVIATGAAAPRTRAPDAPTPLELTPCHVEGLAEEVRCGIHEVFEDRVSQSGPMIPIHIAVLPALRRAAAEDPLFILAGGPGQGARGYAGGVARAFKEIRRHRAIVLVDLRGTGDSHPLACLEHQDEIAALSAAPPVFLGAARACLDAISADVRHYTHRSALADLDEIRQRLGYGRINLWGGSWGTRAALLYALAHPAAVRAVILDGAVPLGFGFPQDVAPHAQRALDLLRDRCAADAACAALSSDLARDLDALLATLERTPVTAAIRHPRTGADVRVTLTRDAVAEIVRVALYTTTDAARVPLLVRRALDGDVAPLAAQFVHSAALTSDDMALGATISILCSEDMPEMMDDVVRARARGTFLGTAYADAWRSRCRDWPAGAPIAAAASVSAAPALILSGMHDPVTPPSTGDAMARHFPNHQHLVVPGAAHNASFTGCVPDLIATFLQRGTAAPLETGCLASSPLPPIVGVAGGRP